MEHCRVEFLVAAVGVHLNILRQGDSKRSPRKHPDNSDPAGMFAYARRREERLAQRLHAVVGQYGKDQGSDQERGEQNGQQVGILRPRRQNKKQERYRHATQVADGDDDPVQLQAHDQRRRHQRQRRRQHP